MQLMLGICLGLRTSQVLAEGGKYYYLEHHFGSEVGPDMDGSPTAMMAIPSS